MSSTNELSGKALASFVLGLLSLVFAIFTAVPALLLGWAGIREINESEGRLRGRGLAVGGMALGAVVTLLCIEWVTWSLIAAVRQQAKRAECENNLRWLGARLIDYQDKKGSFPPGTVATKDLTSERRLSWYVSLLPFANRQDLYDRFDPQQAWDAEANRAAASTRLHWAMCPAYAEPVPLDSPALTQYVGIAGVGQGAASLPKDDPRAGVFGYDRRTRIEDVTRGMEYTMMVAETAAENGPWAAGGPATVRGLDPDLRPYIGPGRPFGGLHRGGLNVLYVDGSVHFVTEKVDPELFEKRATIREPQAERKAADR